MATTKNPPETNEEELISIRLPLTKENQQPVFIRCNQETWLVKRGVTVQLPKRAVEILENSEKAMLAGMEYQAAHVKGE